MERSDKIGMRLEFLSIGSKCWVKIDPVNKSDFVTFGTTKISVRLCQRQTLLIVFIKIMIFNVY